MKRSVCKLPHTDSRRRVYAHSTTTALPVLTSVITVVTIINSRGYFSNPYGSQSRLRLSAPVDARNTKHNLGLGNRFAFRVIVKGFASWSPRLGISQSPSTVFDQLLIAEGEDKGLMREAFKEIRMATVPSDRDRWNISDDRKGIERKFEFKSFGICWVRWISKNLETYVQYRDITLAS